MGLKIKVAKTRFTRLCFKELLARHSLFFIGNSQLNCWIIESIFDMSLVYLHTCMLVQLFMSRESAASQLCYLEFSFGYLENSLLRISLSWIFKKDREFFALNPTKIHFSWKIGKNKGRLSTNFLCIIFAQYCKSINVSLPAYLIARSTLPSSPWDCMLKFSQVEKLGA